MQCLGTSSLQTMSNSLSVWILSKDSNDHSLNILIFFPSEAILLVWRWQKSKVFFPVNNNLGDNIHFAKFLRVMP